MTREECRQMARRDFLSIDALELVTYQARLGDDSFGIATEVQCLWQTPDQKSGGPGAVGSTVTIQVDAEPLVDEFVGPMGKIVRGDQTEWSVVSATLENWGSCWRLDLIEETSDEPE